MSDDEQKVWSYLIQFRRATNEEVAEATGVPLELVEKCIAKIGTPEHVWRSGADIVLKSERVALLDEASSVTSGDRQRDYGPPVDLHQKIADIFNAWTGLNLTARQIAQVHVATKMARRENTPTHRDSYVDAMAYTGIEYECAIANQNKR